MLTVPEAVGLAVISRFSTAVAVIHERTGAGAGAVDRGKLRRESTMVELWDLA